MKTLLFTLLSCSSALLCQQPGAAPAVPQCARYAPGKPYSPGDAISFVLHFPQRPAAQYSATLSLTPVAGASQPAGTPTPEHLVGFGVAIDTVNAMRFRIQIPADHPSGTYRIEGLAVTQIGEAPVAAQDGALASITGLCFKIVQPSSRSVGAISAAILEPNTP